MSVQIQSLFKKPINRTIEGVIKADDMMGLQNELEEYVITDEVSNHLNSFFDAYNHYAGANGVWISGFFGSGKSHLLKMLALLMENRVVNGIPALDYFLPKCTDDEFLPASMKQAVQIPSESILFNIDQKSNIKNKDQPDAVLAVFTKVFNNLCGYYGEQSYIANFERDLDEEGLYESFKETYEKVNHEPWVKAREKVVLKKRNVDRVFELVTGNASPNIIDSYRTTEQLSIEGFCENVKKYIDKKGSNFRLNFFVDEVGQYVANRVELMVNLQTIAETLATKCEGRSWVIITAQEDMDTVLGNQNKQQSNDFSKIQARFKTRIKLTSMNVSEVIQKRLLAKTDDAATGLIPIYEKQRNNFKTLFDFVDDSRHFKNFQSQEHFLNSYPFIPYQFDLFQASIENLSACQAFEGKHSSVGERSMLGVFQEVIKQIRDKELGELATFDLMFEGIRNSLKSQVQKAILIAQNNLDDDFAVQVLKALFLVKYIPYFKATISNIAILMYSHFDMDVEAQKDTIQKALAKLESQSYVERNGTIYSFLTDTEKDIERQIKETEVDESEITQALGGIVYDEVLDLSKVKDPVTGQFHQFTRKIDNNRVSPREFELGINVITPQYSGFTTQTALLAESTAFPNVLVVLPDDMSFISELWMYKKTEKFCRLNASLSDQDDIQRIIADKKEKNIRRRKEIIDQVQAAITDATLLVNGSEKSVAGNAKDRVTSAFMDLVASVYFKRLDREYKESEIPTYLKTSMLDGELTAPEREVLVQINNNKAKGIKTELSKLLQALSCHPFGWVETASKCILALLFSRGKIEFTNGLGQMNAEAVKLALTNSRELQKVTVDVVADYSAREVRELKNFCNDFFGYAVQSKDPKNLADEAKENFIRLRDELIQIQDASLPFNDRLQEICNKLTSLSNKERDYLYRELPESFDELLDCREDEISPMLTFCKGQQKKLFEESKAFITDNKYNRDVVSEDYDEVDRLLKDSKIYSGNKINAITTKITSLKGRIDQAITVARQEVLAYLSSEYISLQKINRYQDLTENSQSIVENLYGDWIKRSESSLNVVQFNLIRSDFDAKGRAEIIQKIMSLPVKAPVITPNPGTGGSSKIINPPVKKAENKSLPLSTLRPSKTIVIKDKEDVDAFVEEIRQKLLREVESGKQILIV